MRYPTHWHTNAPDSTESCRFFHPEPFDSPPPTEAFRIDPAVAVQLRLTSEPYASAVSGLTRAPDHVQVLNEEQTTVAERRATRVEWRAAADIWGLPQGSRATQYVVDAGARTVYLTSPDTATAGTYQANRAVLAEMVESLQLRDQAREDCSAAQEGATRVPAEQAGLPQAVAETRRPIFHAATRCDYQRLERLAGESFTYSFGEEGDFGAFLRRQEAHGGEPLRYLVGLLDRPYATLETPAGPQYVWPSAFAYDDWRDVAPEDRDALQPLYDEDDFADFQQFGAYIGYRIGMSADGRWLFFVAGD